MVIKLSWFLDHETPETEPDDQELVTADVGYTEWASAYYYYAISIFQPRNPIAVICD